MSNSVSHLHISVQIYLIGTAWHTIIISNCASCKLCFAWLAVFGRIPGQEWRVAGVVCVDWIDPQFSHCHRPGVQHPAEGRISALLSRSDCITSSDQHSIANIIHKYILKRKQYAVCNAWKNVYIMWLWQQRLACLSTPMVEEVAPMTLNGVDYLWHLVASFLFL